MAATGTRRAGMHHRREPRQRRNRTASACSRSATSSSDDRRAVPPAPPSGRCVAPAPATALLVNIGTTRPAMMTITSSTTSRPGPQAERDRQVQDAGRGQVHERRARPPSNASRPMKTMFLRLPRAHQRDRDRARRPRAGTAGWRAWRPLPTASAPGCARPATGAARPTSGAPRSGGCCVHAATAVSRKPAMTAVVKPNSISWPCQSGPAR